MDLDTSMSAASSIRHALALERENAEALQQARVLREALDTGEQAAAELLRMLGIGGRLDLVA